MLGSKRKLSAEERASLFAAGEIDENSKYKSRRISHPAFAGLGLDETIELSESDGDEPVEDFNFDPNYETDEECSDEEENPKFAYDGFSDAEGDWSSIGYGIGKNEDVYYIWAKTHDIDDSMCINMLKKADCSRFLHRSKNIPGRFYAIMTKRQESREFVTCTRPVNISSASSFGPLLQKLLEYSVSLIVY